MNIGDEVVVASNAYESGCPYGSVCTVLDIRSGVFYVFNGDEQDTRNPYPFFKTELEEIK